MNAVVSALQLVGLLTFGLLYLLGLDWLVVGPLLYGSLVGRPSKAPFIEALPLALAAGLIVNYGLVLAVQALNPAMLVGAALALTGLGFFGAHLIHHYRRDALTWRAAAPLLGAAGLSLLYVGPILAEPLSAWDARSVWFFHAKMMYYAGTIGLSAGWLDPTAVFSHTDYPKLVTVMGAQVATLLGSWNEYLPKASLLFMFVPATLWIFGFARRSLSFAVLVLLLPFGLSSLLPPYGLFPWMWNGYMDGYLAMYFAIAVLLLGRYLKTHEPLDLISALTILIMLVNLKNEGLLVAISGLAVALWALLRGGRFTFDARLAAANSKYMLALMVGLAPAILWALYKQQWGLQGILDLSHADTWVRLYGRLTDGTLGFILQQMWATGRAPLLMLGVLGSIYAAWNRSIPQDARAALLAGVLYSLAIAAIYLITPAAVDWHVETSLHRLMLSVQGCIFAAIYSLLNALESEGDTGAQRAAHAVHSA